MGCPWGAVGGCSRVPPAHAGCCHRGAPVGPGPGSFTPLGCAAVLGELSGEPKGVLVPLPLGVLVPRAEGAGWDGAGRCLLSSPWPCREGSRAELPQKQNPKTPWRGSRCRPRTNCASWEGAGTGGRNSEGGSVPRRVLLRGPASSQTLQLVPGVLSRGATSLGGWVPIMVGVPRGSPAPRTCVSPQLAGDVREIKSQQETSGSSRVTEAARRSCSNEAGWGCVCPDRVARRMRPGPVRLSPAQLSPNERFHP